LGFQARPAEPFNACPELAERVQGLNVGFVLARFVGTGHTSTIEYIGHAQNEARIQTEAR
jgi:hypothetical protein